MNSFFFTKFKNLVEVSQSIRLGSTRSMCHRSIFILQPIKHWRPLRVRHERTNDICKTFLLTLTVNRQRTILLLAFSFSLHPLIVLSYLSKPTANSIEFVSVVCFVVVSDGRNWLAFGCRLKMFFSFQIVEFLLTILLQKDAWNRSYSSRPMW